VKFEGDENAASVPSAEVRENASPTSFFGKPLWQRALIVLAGPMANFILAIAIFTATFMIVGVSVSDPVVDSVVPGSAAAEAGLKPGDRLVSIDGQKIRSFMDVRKIVSVRAGEKLTTVIDRGGRKLTVVLTPKIKEVPDGLGGKTRIGMIGITHNVAKDTHFERKGPVEALSMGVKQTWQIISGTMSYLKKLVVGEAKSDQVAGPIRIAQYTSMAASVSFAVLINLAAILSVSIGLVNLFPVPMLDGGHLLYYLIEAVRGKPLGQSAQELGFKVGLALVLALMLATTFNDILHLFSS
jgi:regulator of sigma E protease